MIMRKHIFIFLTLIVSGYIQFSKHFHVIIKNQSEKGIYLVRVGRQPEECFLVVQDTIKANSVFKYRPYNFGIERSLGGTSTLELCLVDPEKYNGLQEPHDCYKLPSVSCVLAYYNLTLEDLERRDFTLIYPE